VPGEEPGGRLLGRVSGEVWWDGVRAAQLCRASRDASEGSVPSTCTESEGHPLGLGWLQEGSTACPSHVASLKREGLVSGLVTWSRVCSFSFFTLFQLLSLHPVKGCVPKPVY